ncbi:hypothetical protein ASD50_16160 [Mesorhizobium sp. Root552]|uniref:BA14K family protein n=1 Tax=Mesorhizobium sp. Root552 TaxID=1736555 RepID=UPI0006F52E18|nr:BA14K family protein [Mesorhizobium sp. Root552]KQZ31059.1 hypothetical protein ASD50_16160 [Mesorhizobium sp. Root552]
MNRILKASVLSFAVGATTLAMLPAAHADDWRWRRHHRHNDDALAAGVIGLAAGALIGGALASQPRYYEPEPTYVIREPRPAPVRRYYRADYDYGGAYEPWSPEWYQYCSDRYRSFNPRTGTFVGYDGLRHFCQAN